MSEKPDDLLHGIADQTRRTNIPVTAKYHRHRKVITVDCGFDRGQIQTKLIGTPDVWLVLWRTVDEDAVSFEILQPLLGRKPGKASRGRLQRYASTEPNRFAQDFFECLYRANLTNPLATFEKMKRHAVKQKIDLELTLAERDQVSATAAHLYVFLKHMGAIEEEDLPNYYQKFAVDYHVNIENLQNYKTLREEVRRILSDWIGVEFSQRFWKTFIEETPISIDTLSQLKVVRDVSRNPFLFQIFRPYLKS
jgi:hypothetical protein